MRILLMVGVLALTACTKDINYAFQKEMKAFKEYNFKDNMKRFTGYDELEKSGAVAKTETALLNAGDSFVDAGNKVGSWFGLTPVLTPEEAAHYHKKPVRQPSQVELEEVYKAQCVGGLTRQQVITSNGINDEASYRQCDNSNAPMVPVKRWAGK